MAILLGGKRWLERPICDDECDDGEEEISAIDDDYIREEYRSDSEY